MPRLDALPYLDKPIVLLRRRGGGDGGVGADGDGGAIARRICSRWPPRRCLLVRAAAVDEE